MRSHAFILAVMFLLSGCATLYDSIYPNNPRTVARAEDENIRVSVGKRDMGTNDRMNERAQEEGLTLREMTIENKADIEVSILYDEILLVKNDTPYLPVDSAEAYHYLKLATFPYLLWSFVSLRVSKEICSGCVCRDEITYYPAGIPIGILQMMIAGNGNRKMENELKALQFQTTIIQPGEAASGLVYYQLPLNRNTHVRVMYRTDRGIFTLDVL